MYERNGKVFHLDYMQHLNYIDVTHEYWDISNVTVPCLQTQFRLYMLVYSAEVNGTQNGGKAAL